MTLFLLNCMNSNIPKSAKFIIAAEIMDEARQIYKKTFIASSGMAIVNITDVGVLYLLDDRQ